MAGNDKMQRMPEQKTTKLPRAARQNPQQEQATLKRSRVVGGADGTSRYADSSAPRHVKRGKETSSYQGIGGSGLAQGEGQKGKKSSKGKTIAVVVTIVLLVCALALALAWGFGLFNKQEAPQQETTEDTTVPDTTPTPEPAGDESDVSYTRYATGEVSLEYPTSWSVMTYQGAQTVVVSRGTVGDGYIKIAPASVSEYGADAVADTSTMRAFASAVAQSEQLDVDITDLAIGQRDGLWVASVSLTDTISGKDAKGSQMIAASGDEAYIITALCPTDTYAQNWPYFKHVLDSISFNASADFPDEGRD